MQVNCVDGWMIIDPSIEPKGWANYFNGWKKYGTKGGGAYGPLKAGLLKHTTTSFVNWFKLPVKKPKTELSSSDDCKTCGGAQRGKAYVTCFVRMQPPSLHPSSPTHLSATANAYVPQHSL